MNSENPNNLKPGDVVKFAKPYPDEETDRFVVIELRGPRVLVEDAVSAMRIRPTFVYLACDLIRI